MAMATILCCWADKCVQAVGDWMSDSTFLNTRPSDSWPRARWDFAHTTIILHRHNRRHQQRPSPHRQLCPHFRVHAFDREEKWEENWEESSKEGQDKALPYDSPKGLAARAPSRAGLTWGWTRPARTHQWSASCCPSWAWRLGRGSRAASLPPAPPLQHHHLSHITAIFKYQTSHTLGSSSKKLLKIPKSNLKSFGLRSFSFIGPFVWNSLPASLQNLPTLNSKPSSWPSSINRPFHRPR